MSMSAAAADFGKAIKNYPLWLHLGWEEVARRYRRTILGPLWHTLTLAIFVVAMGVVWGTMLNFPISEYIVSLTPSLIAWAFISGVIVDGASLFVAAQTVVLTLRLPYPMLAFSLVWRWLVMFAHHMVLAVFVAVVFWKLPNTNTLLLVPGLALAVVNAVWMGLLIGLVCLRFRDLQVVVGTAMQIMFFVTPVFWPVERITPNLAWMVQYNPLAHLLELIRAPIQGIAPSAENWTGALLFAIVGWAVTFVFYAFARRRLAYWF